ncbi:hypothetical protein VNO77_01413 [Canavalia gladiata]|uniref:Uncharacterized protein n=1 Tax=Canavalia gladiata TaxID=3824 RepID=A0AAN9MXN6_CANGL
MPFNSHGNERGSYLRIQQTRLLKVAGTELAKQKETSRACENANVFRPCACLVVHECSRDGALISYKQPHLTFI